MMVQSSFMCKKNQHIIESQNKMVPHHGVGMWPMHDVGVSYSPFKCQAQFFIKPRRGLSFLNW